MNIKLVIAQGYKSLMIHRLRAVLSTLGILFGVAAVIAMLAVGEGAKKEALEQISSLGMKNLIIRRLEITEEQKTKNRTGNSTSLTIEDGEYLASHVSNITRMAGVNRIKADVQAAHMQFSPEIMAVTNEYAKVKELSLLQGRFLTSLDLQQSRRICVLGWEVARSLGRLGQLDQTIRIEGVEFRIVGILKSQQGIKHPVAHQIDQSIFIPLGTEAAFPRKAGEKRDPLTEIILQFDSSEQIMMQALLAKRILSQRHRQIEDFQVIVPYELMNQAIKTQYTFNLVLVSIAGISLVVGGIGIMNIMLATISERTREIGIRRAVGATSRHIMNQFLIETMLLSGVGGVLGVVAGCVVSACISFIAGWPIVITLVSAALSLGMALVVGICAGLYPAMKAARMHPIVALRQY